MDGSTIVAAIVPPGLGPAPVKPITPLGPKIEVGSPQWAAPWSAHYLPCKTRFPIVYTKPPPPPAASATPTLPPPQDNSSGRKSQARTYPDLLQGPHDEQLFEYYCQSRLVTVDVRSGAVTHIGSTTPRLYTATSPSPDGRYLLVSWLERPYSYSLPCGRFPKRVQLWKRCVECVGWLTVYVWGGGVGRAAGSL